jgi:hypothetical protein
MTPRPPLWLATPSRFAALPQKRARVALALLAALLLATLLALTGPARLGHDSAPGDHDVVLYQTIVQGLRGGGNYYATAADALRAGDYPMHPFVTFRLPTLAVVLYTLAAGVVVAWYLRLRPAFARPIPRLVAMLLLGGGLLAFVQDELIAFHEVWAGLLIALSLAVRRDDRWIEAVALGLCAMLIRETALLYVAIMALFALAERRQREALGWASTIGVFAIALALHAHAVALVVQPTDPVSPGWAGLLGFGFFVKTMQVSTALALAPLWLAAPLVGLALFGWAAWNSPLAVRALAIFTAYTALLALFGRTDTFYWGLMIAPTLLIGLAFAPDGVRDLLASARGPRRRITVTRVTR